MRITLNRHDFQRLVRGETVVITAPGRYAQVDIGDLGLDVLEDVIAEQRSRQHGQATSDRAIEDHPT